MGVVAEDAGIAAEARIAVEARAEAAGEGSESWREAMSRIGDGELDDDGG